ncbi:MAG: hypothetical protein ACO3P9_11760, partial [Phycisphaerales bacterium]
MEAPFVPVFEPALVAEVFRGEAFAAAFLEEPVDFTATFLAGAFELFLAVFLAVFLTEVLAVVPLEVA